MSSTATGSSGSSFRVASPRGRTSDSDYDIAVFIEDPASLGEELHHLAFVTTDILLETGAVISAIPFRAGAYRERTSFMQELRNDGLDL